MIRRRARLEVALRFDIDSCVAAREALPRLLGVLGRFGARATFLVALGSHTCAPVDLRWLGPSPEGNRIGSRAPGAVERSWIDPSCLANLRAAQVGGHELGLLGWDAAGWRRRMSRWYPSRVTDEYVRGARDLVNLVGQAPAGSGAPGWLATETTLSIADTFGFAWASDVLGFEPFYPKIGERRLRTIQVPVTLPVGGDQEGGRTTWKERVLERVGEGGSHVLAAVASARRPVLELEPLLMTLASRGARFATLGEVAARCAKWAPTCEVAMGEAGLVARQGPRVQQPDVTWRALVRTVFVRTLGPPPAPARGSPTGWPRR